MISAVKSMVLLLPKWLIKVKRRDTIATSKQDTKMMCTKEYFLLFI